ncbi:MAG TPA: hypothetical protein VH681_09415 [Nitrospiraceae bacterium]|jgi:hypothetical protein
MAKKTAQESDEARLKKKIADHKEQAGNPALRAIRKRLKRIQRKRRSVALRKKHAAGHKTEAAAPAATA